MTIKKNFTPILAAAFLSASLLLASCGNDTDTATDGVDESATPTEMDMDTAGTEMDTTGTTTM